MCSLQIFLLLTIVNKSILHFIIAYCSYLNLLASFLVGVAHWVSKLALKKHQETLEKAQEQQTDDVREV